MITLCGIPLSNYYTKAKLVLLEKGIPFTEEYVKTHSHAEEVLSCSPLGKRIVVGRPVHFSSGRTEQAEDDDAFAEGRLRTAIEPGRATGHLPTSWTFRRRGGNRRSSWASTRCRTPETSGRSCGPRRPPGSMASSCPSTTRRA